MGGYIRLTHFTFTPTVSELDSISPCSYMAIPDTYPLTHPHSTVFSPDTTRIFNNESFESKGETVSVLSIVPRENNPSFVSLKPPES